MKRALSVASATEFDRSYIAAQISRQQEVLALLDEKLISQAQDPRLKAALVAAR
jgi:predicted outer membrane protein